MMKCKVCGSESGKYPLCKECNRKKEIGEIIKCPKCQKWHYAHIPCIEELQAGEEKFLYELKVLFCNACFPCFLWGCLIKSELEGWRKKIICGRRSGKENEWLNCLEDYLGRKWDACFLAR